MKIKELRDMNDEQLIAVLNDAKHELFRLRLQAGTDKLDSPTELKKNRRIIARIKTLQREREMKAQAAAE